MKWPWSRSIAQRIKWAFYVLMALVILGLILSWVNMGQISTQIDALKTTSGFLDTVWKYAVMKKTGLFTGAILTTI